MKFVLETSVKSKQTITYLFKTFLSDGFGVYPHLENDGIGLAYEAPHHDDSLKTVRPEKTRASKTCCSSDEDVMFYISCRDPSFV